MKSKTVHLYTDGSSLGNPGPGGYGIILQLETKSYIKEFSQGFVKTTNNRILNFLRTDIIFIFFTYQIYKIWYESCIYFKKKYYEV